MNWYTTLKLAMPLPQAEGTPTPGNFDYGHKAVDKKLTQPEADQINQQYQQMAYLGSGVDGIAYTHSNPNTVVKITSDENEASNAFSLMSQPAPCCARVFSVKENSQETWTIEVEKVQPVTGDEAYILGKLHGAMNKNRPHNLSASDPQVQKLTKEFNALMRCLKKNGLPTRDAHFNNVGRNSKGTLVLFEFGIGESNWM